MSDSTLPPDLQVGVLQSSPTNRRIFVNVLHKECGAQVRATGQPREAMNMLRGDEIAVFLGEKSLMTGQKEDSILEKVQANPNVDPPPILLTGYQFDRKEAVRLIRSGVAGLLLLPFQPESLVAKIRAALGDNNISAFRP